MSGNSSTSPRKILVIDDEPAMVQLITLIFNDGDIEVLGAYDGTQGLEMVESVRPDLVMLDDMMPGLNGYDVNERIKASDTLRDIPVVLLTAKNPSFIARVIHRFQGVLNKPFSPDEVYSVVAAALDIRLVSVETNPERTLAEVFGWPGWFRSGPDEESALQALFDVGPRYARALQAEGIACHPPQDIRGLVVVRRRENTSTAEFFDYVLGRLIPRWISQDDRIQFEAILRAGWQTFAAAVDAVAGRKIAHGPDSDPRNLDQIIQHVLESSHEYLDHIGWPLELDSDAPFDVQRERLQAAMFEGLSAPAKDAPKPPPDDQHWPIRYFMRRSAWHLFDHAWEIEDRLE